MAFFLHSNTPPNGYLVQGLIIYNRLEQGGCAVKGFVIEAPDFRQAPDNLLNECQDRLRDLLHGMSGMEGWHWSRTTISNFDPELTRFEAITQTVSHPWIRRRREEVARRYRERMAKGELRRHRLVLFISRKIEPSVGWMCGRRELERRHQAILDQLTSEFAARQVHLRQALARIFHS